MFFIVGSMTKVSFVASLFFACAICHNEAAQRLFRARRWHTIFFLPIYPLGHGRYVMQCAHCGSESPVPRDGAERFKADAESFMADDEASTAA